MAEPYMPETAERTASFFGLTFKKGGAAKALSWEDIGRDDGLDRVVKSEVLFAKLEDEKIAELRERYSGSQAERKEAGSKEQAASNKQQETGNKEQGAGSKEQGTSEAAEAAPVKLSPEEILEKFPSTLDLRVARIVKIERHPKADKLYIETLEIAGEERVIVSGLVPFYREEELLGKHIIVAYNLKPAKLRGVESRGMLLAASVKDAEGKETVEVLDAGAAPAGTRVGLTGAGAGSPPAEIDIDAFFSIPLEVEDYTVLAGGRALTLENNPIKTKLVARGEVH
jgi:methionyl-tRNA synthetase